MRAGAHALNLLSVPLHVHVITALEEEPRSLMDLRRAVGSPPQTTMRKQLRTLVDLGVLERRREADFPGSVDYELGVAGKDLALVLDVVGRWFAYAPYGPVEPGEVAAKSALKALTEGWSSTIVRALAARPLSLTELNRLIPGLNYPSLERRLGALRLSGLIAPVGNGQRTRPYVATEWLGRAMGPLVAAIRWERRHDNGYSSPLTRIDVESIFLSAIPMLRLDPDLSGTARVSVESRRAEGGVEVAGVMVGVEDGRVVSCVSRLEGNADAWAGGSATAWLEALLGQDRDMLEVGGDARLVFGLLDELAGAILPRTAIDAQKQAG